ncbi:MAG: SpoVA/SpoVAEb family sporulation membrane protein [Clostridia bacterium]|nr:SpoVA/SpoVAEb family sporulation membrane protein [Clostridia bacterium]
MGSDNLTKLNGPKYEKMKQDRSMKSNLLVDCAIAFVSGGFICIIAQVFKDIITSGKLVDLLGTADEKSASALTVLFMVFLGALLTSLNVYDNIGKVCGAGSIVPITGFANSIVSSAMEFRSEGHILGVGAQMFICAGPVIVYGTAASVIAGLFYFLFTMG